MSSFFSWLGSVLSELRRRNVLQVAAGYAVGAWVAIQVASITFDALFFPRWALTAVIVVAMLGFPIALVLAWRYDLTSEGLRRAEPAGTDAETVAMEPARRRVAIFLLAVGLVATVGAGWTAWRAWSAASGAEGPDGRSVDGDGPAQLDPQRIAVLPFADHSSGGELAGVASGLTADLIQELGRVKGLDLVSYFGVQPYGDPGVTLDSVARALRAGTLVEGRIERSGDSLDLAATLVDGGTGTRIGSVEIRTQRDSLLALRAELVDRVARELRKALGTRLELHELRAGTKSDRAWELFQRARENRFFADTLALKGDTSSARGLFDHADSLLATAESLSRDWTAPAVERVRVALARAELGFRTRSDLDTTWLVAGDSLAGAVLSREPENSEALGLRGVLRYRASKVRGFGAPWASVDSAEPDLRRAVDLDPGNSRAWSELAMVLDDDGRSGEALMAARRSKEADPFLRNDLQYLFNSAWMDLQFRNFEAAERLIRRGRSLFPDEPAYDGLHLTLLAGPEGPVPDPDTAWAVLREIEDTYGIHWSPGRLLVAAALLRAGLADSARSMLAREQEGPIADPFTYYGAANLYVQLGRPDSAVAMLRRYVEAAPKQRRSLASDWWYESLRDRPDFQRLVQSADSRAVAAEGDRP